MKARLLLSLLKTSGQATWDTCTLEEATGEEREQFPCQVFPASCASVWLVGCFTAIVGVLVLPFLLTSCLEVDSMLFLPLQSLDMPGGSKGGTVVDHVEPEVSP